MSILSLHLVLDFRKAEMLLSFLYNENDADSYSNQDNSECCNDFENIKFIWHY
jgi:hypothetical protein